MFILSIGLLIVLSHVSTAEKIDIKLDEKTKEIFEECMKSSDVTMDDLKGVLASGNFTRNIYCMMKCQFEKNKFLREGIIDISQLDNEDKLIYFTKEQLPEFKKCLAHVGKIEECEDLEKVSDCFPHKTE